MTESKFTPPLSYTSNEQANWSGKWHECSRQISRSARTSVAPPSPAHQLCTSTHVIKWCRLPSASMNCCPNKKTNQTTSRAQIVPSRWISSREHSQVIESAGRGVDGTPRPRPGLRINLQRVAGCAPPNGCALMCFTGLTADSDKGMDDAACQFVVGRKKKKESLVSRPGERR